MFSLRDQSGLDQILDMTKYMSGIIIGVFIFAMSIVLWNAGLMSSLRRYGEIGLRMALGESKTNVYRSMIGESILIGLFGSVLGTGFGLLVAYYLQNHGIDFGSMMKGSTMLLSNVMRAQVTITSYYIGFFPGLIATTLGTMISGIGIYRRQTSQLFKELEV
jgi:putative ABC transport system permease protein